MPPFGPANRSKKIKFFSVAFDDSIAKKRDETVKFYSHFDLVVVHRMDNAIQTRTSSSQVHSKFSSLYQNNSYQYLLKVSINKLVMFNGYNNNRHSSLFQKVNIQGVALKHQ